MGCFPINSASGNNFQLSFPKLPFSSTLTDSKLLTLHLYDTVLPGCSFDIDTMSWNGKDTKQINSNLNFNTFPISFDIDETFQNWFLIFDWLSNISDNNENVGISRKEFSIDASLMIFDNYHKPLMKIKYVNMFPYELGDVSLSYRNGETYLEGTSTFSFDYFIPELF